MISYGVAQKPPSGRECWGTQELRRARGHKGQDRTNVRVAAGEPRLHSAVSPTQGSAEVGSELEWSLPCPPLGAPSPLPGELYPLAPWKARRALTLPLGPQLGHIPSLASVYPLGMGGRKAEQTPWCLGPRRTSQGGNQSVLLPAFITKATERGGTEVMGRVAQSPGLGEELVIPGVVMATGELMWNCGVPMETGLVTMGIPEGNSWFP